MEFKRATGKPYFIEKTLSYLRLLLLKLGVSGCPMLLLLLLLLYYYLHFPKLLLKQYHSVHYIN